MNRSPLFPLSKGHKLKAGGLALLFLFYSLPGWALADPVPADYLLNSRKIPSIQSITDSLTYDDLPEEQISLLWHVIDESSVDKIQDIDKNSARLSKDGTRGDLLSSLDLLRCVLLQERGIISTRLAKAVSAGTAGGYESLFIQFCNGVSQAEAKEVSNLLPSLFTRIDSTENRGDSRSLDRDALLEMSAIVRALNRYQLLTDVDFANRQGILRWLSSKVDEEDDLMRGDALLLLLKTRSEIAREAFRKTFETVIQGHSQNRLQQNVPELMANYCIWPDHALFPEVFLLGDFARSNEDIFVRKVYLKGMENIRNVLQDKKDTASLLELRSYLQRQVNLGDAEWRSGSQELLISWNDRKAEHR